MKEIKIETAEKPIGAPLLCQTKPPHRILVVEDDSNIRVLNTEVLIHSGYHVDAASDGAAAWETLQRNSYDLLVTDNEMPKVTGVELLKKLHAVRRAMPVIMATGTLPQDEFARHPWLKPAATLIKPYTVSELLGTVREVLCANPGSAEPLDPPPNRRTQI